MLRCFQRLSHPYVATQRCSWQNNWYTSGTFIPVLSYSGTNLLNFPTPTEDRDRTVSRRSEPSSRTALNGEQPYPWDLLQPQDAMTPTSRCQTSPSMWALGGDQPVIPGVPFILWAMGPSTQNHRITMTDFRLCSTCMSHSQASLCHYTQQAISIRFELTFVSLRYFLGGDRPSQTTHQTLSWYRITVPS